jgi:hypothetical protein
MKPLRLLKIDSVHPPESLLALQKSAGPSLAAMSYEEYCGWLMEQRLNLSDYLTKPMREEGWDARELVPVDTLLIEKFERSAGAAGGGMRDIARFVASVAPRDVTGGRVGRMWREAKRRNQVARCIEGFQPDVLFVREPCHVDGRVFDAFRDRCLVVGMIACDPAHAVHWNARRHDVIFTATPEFRDYFRSLGIRSEILPFGVDERVATQVEGLPKIYDCTFVGYLGAPHQRKKTELLARVAGEVDFKWWGVKGPEIGEFPALERTYQGKAAGLDMIKIYKQSKIVVNDYPDFMQGHSNNMRNMEVFGVGSFLLTRAAEALRSLEAEGALSTFTDADDCVGKIKHYLMNEEERERIAARGLQVALRDFNYKDIARKMIDVIAEVREQRSCGGKVGR